MSVWKRIFYRLTFEKRRSLMMIGIFTVFSTIFLSFISLYYMLEFRKGEVGKEVETYISIRNVEMDESYPGPIGLTEESKKKVDRLAGIEKVWESCATQVMGDSFAFIGYKGRGVPLEAWESTGCLLYTSDMKEHAFFKETGYSVVKGEFPKEEKGDMQAVIAESLGLMKTVHMGDKETVKTMSGETVPLEITGMTDIFDGIEVENCIFVTKDTVFKAMETPGYREVRYYLKDAARAEEFVESVKALELQEENSLQISSNLLAYQQALSMIENVQRFLWGCLILVLFLSVVIIGLLYLHELLEREKEFGVLLALGEKKRRIILQFLGEICIPIGISSVMAVIFSKGVAILVRILLGENSNIMGNMSLDFRSILVLLLCNLIIVAVLIVIEGMLIFRKNTKQMLEKGD